MNKISQVGEVAVIVRDIGLRNEFCFHNVVHLWFEQGHEGAGHMEMCQCNIWGFGTPVEKSISAVAEQKLRDYLRDQLFYYSPTDKWSDERRRIQRQFVARGVR